MYPYWRFEAHCQASPYLLALASVCMFPRRLGRLKPSTVECEWIFPKRKTAILHRCRPTTIKAENARSRVEEETSIHPSFHVVHFCVLNRITKCVVIKDKTYSENIPLLWITSHNFLTFKHVCYISVRRNKAVLLLSCFFARKILLCFYLNSFSCRMQSRASICCHGDGFFLVLVWHHNLCISSSLR